ncbi:hypothetical protein GIB67_026042 [Kingdonia uniflora]|uniref:Bifunctional inhibitor/plant lipid transfer protein/seed storage helical domain-containing protein n=1 Tax=Kingdonia uniflora TaxID=39325 RepID=A0A7J7M2W6_9MAGN|nr:hypothetical protein GIB67_026042 [Kingdonia uniflora]
MAKLCMVLCVLALWVMVSEVNCATPEAPAPSVDCNTLIFTMADCLTFVSNDSKATKPEGGCCKGLKSVLKTNAECLCEAFKSSAQIGVVLNTTKALALPAACGVKAPSISNCGLSLGVAPGAAPVHSPKSSIPKSSAPVSITIAPAGAPNSGISDTGAPAPAPATQKPKSGASTVSVTLLALVSLAVASCSLF